MDKLANMEPEYDKPMHFDPDLIPATARGIDLQTGLWDYGVVVHGAGKKSKGKYTPTLEAATFRFREGEELIAVKDYLYWHGKYQLVSVSNFLIWS